tara:strand:- start:1951 stop:2259 length:309 start_codon:yes stop_codon:yes gene_type:complete
MEFYVFETESIASAAEQYISQVAGVPITGVRVSDNVLQENKQKTERYAWPQQRVTDNKWVMPRVSKEDRDAQPNEVINHFNTNFPHTVEIYNSEWFSDSDTL